MPQPPQKLVKAELREIRWSETQAHETKRTVPVQFNPETLKVRFANQITGKGQRGGAAIQFVGRGTSTLSFELWFDVTVPLPEGSKKPSEKDQQGDVRRLTHEVAKFMMPGKKVGKNQYIPPAVRFIWGTFKFDGVMDSMDETLEFFSEDGKPLRARVAVSLSRQEIKFEFNKETRKPASTATPGTQPQQQVKAGETTQQIAARLGWPKDWPTLAAKNGIENPRRPAPGSHVSTNSLPQ